MRRRSILDELDGSSPSKVRLVNLLGEATGNLFSPVVQSAPYEPPASEQPAPVYEPVGEAYSGVPWFSPPTEVQNWNYDTETMAGPPGMLADTNLANVIANKAQDMGYTGPMTVGGNTEADSSLGQVAPEFQQWLQSQGLQLGGESAGVNGIGGVNSFLTDQTGSRVAEQTYASDDSDFFNFGVGLLGMGAFSALNAGVGALGGAGDAASAGLFGGEGAAQLAAADLAVTPEALAAITPEIGGLGEVAALGAGQVGALSPNMFANEGLAQLAANPPVVSAAELAGITPDVSGMAFANPFANEGAMQLAANPPTVTPAELASVTPEVSPAVAPAAFNAAQDSQFANQQLGISGAKAIAPTTVNLVNAGGTMATAGGLQGLLDTAAQGVRDATASSELGGSVASQLGNAASGALGTAGSAAEWLNANPMLGRLLMSGAGALVSGLGSSGGGSSAAPTNYGPAKQWTSPIGSGLLSAPRNVQQVQPGGLLGQGVANSGAWQWRK